MPGDGQRPLLDRIRTALRSLSVGLFLWVFGLIILAFAVYLWIGLRTAQQHSQETVYASARRFGALINHSTHYGMLLNRKQDVHHIIQTVARSPGVQAVRIYDKQGMIIYSANPGEIGRKVDLQAEACLICHDHNVPLQAVPSENRVRVFRNSQGNRVLGLIEPIPNEPACSQAPCHAHPVEQTILGVLDVTMSMAQADASLAATRRQMTSAAVIIALVVGVASACFIYFRVRRPVGRLIAGTERIALGDLDSRIEIRRANEISHLAEAINRMTQQLHDAHEEITRWSQELERKVVEKTDELSRSQRQVLHMEKMASLGKLSATVAHELNNPLAGILNYAKLTSRSLHEDTLGDDEKEELQRYLTLIQKESGRCGEIVRNLLLFARRGGAEFALQHLNPLVERALMLVRHHMEMADVTLDATLLEGDDQIICDANQIGQALVALLVNAVEAMPQGGTLTVRLTPQNGNVRMTVADTGVGIAKAALAHVFEPFYSTKHQDSGVGLGLAVVYGIVRRHAGTIEVDSEIGRGTTMRIVLPRRPAGPMETDEGASTATATSVAGS